VRDVKAGRRSGRLVDEFVATVREGGEPQKANERKGQQRAKGSRGQRAEGKGQKWEAPFAFF
jgi:hypothetical protein